MTDTKVFRHINDRQTWSDRLTEYPHVAILDAEGKITSFIHCNTFEQARAVACVPEMLQLIHEMMFALGKDSRKDYFKRGSEILEYVYDV